MEALDVHKTETAKLTEHQENCRLLGKNVRSLFYLLLFLACIVNTNFPCLLNVHKFMYFFTSIFPVTTIDFLLHFPCTRLNFSALD